MMQLPDHLSENFLFGCFWAELLKWTVHGAPADTENDAVQVPDYEVARKVIPFILFSCLFGHN